MKIGDFQGMWMCGLKRHNSCWARRVGVWVRASPDLRNFAKFFGGVL